MTSHDISGATLPAASTRPCFDRLSSFEAAGAVESHALREGCSFLNAALAGNHGRAPADHRRLRSKLLKGSARLAWCTWLCRVSFLPLPFFYILFTPLLRLFASSFLSVSISLAEAPRQEELPGHGGDLRGGFRACFQQGMHVLHSASHAGRSPRTKTF